MEVIAHRGFWDKNNQKNSLNSFENALKHNFGIETDIRDLNGSLVISHDPPNNKKDQLISFKEFLRLYRGRQSNSTLALNIKSDGITQQIKSELIEFNIQRYFIFDMTIPDMMSYLNSGMRVFARESEYEKALFLKDKVDGVLIDSFSEKFYQKLDLEKIFKEWEEICIISPELHKFEKQAFWDKLKHSNYISLCTDHP